MKNKLSKSHYVEVFPRKVQESRFEKENTLTPSIYLNLN